MNTINVHRFWFTAKFGFQIQKYCVLRCWFSPLIWIQEITLFTAVGFHLDSRFTKILCTPIFPLSHIDSRLINHKYWVQVSTLYDSTYYLII